VYSKEDDFVEPAVSVRVRKQMQAEFA